MFAFQTRFQRSKAFITPGHFKLTQKWLIRYFPPQTMNALKWGVRMNLAGGPKDKAELPAALNEFFYHSKTCPVQIEISCE